MSRVGGWSTEGDLTGDQEQNAAKLDNKSGNNDYTDRGIARLKTATGEVSAIIRNSAGEEHIIHATVDSVGKFKFPNGETYQLEVEQIRGPAKPKPINLDKAAFIPPKVTIERKKVGNRDGVQITFEPQTTPGIFTVAPEGAAKPLGLPSFPFPAQFPDGQPRTKVTCFIPIVAVEPPTSQGEGEPFLLKTHTHIRVGVRGAGLFVRGVKIPGVGKRAKIIRPEQYQYLAAQVDAKWTNANRVTQKHSEKVHVLQYT